MSKKLLHQVMDSGPGTLLDLEGIHSVRLRVSPHLMLQRKKKKAKRKFAEACQKIQESVERYLERHDLAQDTDEDEDEDDLEEGAIIDRVYQSYGQGTDGRTQQYLQEAVKSGTLVCLICIDGIKRLDPIWNCGECYSSFHIQCIQKWAKDSIFQMSEAQADSVSDPRAVQAMSNLSWCWSLSSLPKECE
ncbi:NF-X1-type zinc finger protein NFXL1 [Portunus trituberculatus]|uniref:NF-X1-type zinc finger protein NFXL1 n=1 Tax=Portunus trituberculatus TaxID=210409 RepID=A0A5B7CND7_PORTR|nr:NF-X1-type zinc finger protein NFXL1 [Portunus trituberculatus]